MRIKVLSYNVHKLFNITNTKYFLAELKALLSTLDLDFVFLQEMRGLHAGVHSERFDQDPLEHLADELWDYYAYGKNAVYNSGNHGNAILSKYPILEWKNHDVSNHRLERRSFLSAKVELPDWTELYLACTHLDLTQWGRLRQARKIQKIVEENSLHEKNFLFCGDFNDWNGRMAKTFVEMGLKDVTQDYPDRKFASFPSFLPLLCLDKVFIQGNLKCEKFHVIHGKPWDQFSDHLPLYLELSYRET